MTEIPASAILNLRRLLLLRGVAILGWLAALAFVWSRLELELVLAPIGGVIAVWILISLVSWWWLRTRGEISDTVFLTQLVIDIVLLTLLLYLTGGSTNPLTLLFLLPLTISAALLPGIHTWLIALLTILCYTLLLHIFIPLPFSDHMHEQEFGMHVIGMWSGFVLSAALIATFVARMGSTLRQRDHMLALSRERALRDQRIVALGTLAAGAAHELGTPLGTIGLLAAEIEEEHARGDPELAAKARILRQLVKRCKETLAMLSLSAGQSQAGAGDCRQLDDYLASLLQHWQGMRPGVRLASRIESEVPAPQIIAEQTLSQAIISILNNAADASIHVEFSAAWDSAELRLEVCDRGAGIAPAAVSAAGKTAFSTKSSNERLGLGLYLAFSVIERLHGEVRLFNRDGGGACTRVVLPLRQLTVRAAPVRTG